MKKIILLLVISITLVLASGVKKEKVAINKVVENSDGAIRPIKNKKLRSSRSVRAVRKIDVTVPKPRVVSRDVPKVRAARKVENRTVQVREARKSRVIE